MWRQRSAGEAGAYDDDVEVALVGGVYKVLVGFVVGPFLSDRTFRNLRVDLIFRSFDDSMSAKSCMMGLESIMPSPHIAVGATCTAVLDSEPQGIDYMHDEQERQTGRSHQSVPVGTQELANDAARRRPEQGKPNSSGSET